MKRLENWLEDPARRARLRRWFYMGLALVAVAESVLPLAVAGQEPHFSFESLPAWGSLYGLLSCVTIIVISKLLGKWWLMRREDYYDS